MNLFESLFGSAPKQPQQPKQPSITYAMLENLYANNQERLFCENYIMIMRTGVPKFSKEQLNNLRLMADKFECDKYMNKENL